MTASGHAYPRETHRARTLEGIRESWWLMGIGAGCLALSVSFATSKAYEGSSRFPLWELLLALGLIAVVGSLVAAFVPEEIVRPSAGRRARVPAPRARTLPADDDEAEAPGAFPSEAEPSERPARRAEPWAGRPVELPNASAPELPAEGTSSEEALLELDRLAEQLVPRRRTQAAQPILPPSRTSREKGRDRAEGLCGSCGRRLEAGAGASCAGCGASLCDFCFDGLSPPPCPSCATGGGPRTVRP